MPTELRADCANCAGLCCVASAFSRSADFAIDKEAGQPCPHLREDFRCGIHGELRQRGFAGCTVYDCFGAGQQVTQVTFGGRDWRGSPEIGARMFEVFGVMRQLHELLWYLSEALTLSPARSVHVELRAALGDVARLTLEDPDTLAALDVAARRRDIAVLLRRASALTRDGVGRRRADHAGADLVGKDLRRADLHGADLRGAYLIGAGLEGADLRRADLLGADLRGARLAGADLTGALFLLQSQLDAATGDTTTTLPAAHTRPAHWLR
ncbi:MAG: pentapeptide repeat-containing protein [Streptosporangiales bacterium]|nr:pentapeptide repeat-containing protein [Streptosporangiales bacterium]